MSFYACDSEPTSRTGYLTGEVRYTGSSMEMDNVIITLRRVDDGSEEVAERISNTGRFNLRLPAGEYILELQGNRVRSDNLVAPHNRVRISAGETRRKDINVEQLPSSMVILYNNIEYASGDTIRLGAGMALDIFNKYSSNELRWDIRAFPTPSWITFEETSGTVPSGGRRPIVFSVNQDLLPNFGVNYANIILTTGDEGSFTVTVSTISTGRPPTLTTNPITNQTATSATFNGQITAQGVPAFTERGFVFGTTAQPTHANHLGRITSPTNSNPAFSADVSNLIPNTTYFVRAFAIQNGTPVYGNDINFITSGIATVLSTSAVDNISISSATFRANITVEGSPVYTERGFVYSSTNSLPTIQDNRIRVSGTGIGSFYQNVTGLGLQTRYFVRAYAIQDGEVRYGNVVEFTTVFASTVIATSAVDNIGISSATFRANITVEGIPPYTERGFVYSSTNSLPTIQDSRIRVPGTGIGSFYHNVTGLGLQTRYFVRAYAIQNGEVRYGSVVEFTTIFATTVITTSAVTRIDATSATFGANITIEGIPPYTERGFVYSSTNNQPTIQDSRIIVPGTGVGSFYHNVTGLSLATRYYVRAYAIQNGEVIYGNVVSYFNTFTETSIITSQVGSIDVTSATLHATIPVIGEPPYTERGFVFSSTNSLPTIQNNRIRVDGVGVPGGFSAPISGLGFNTTYYVRAYVIQNENIIYGNVVNFRTRWENATVTASGTTNVILPSGATNSTFGSARFNANVTNIGQPVYTEKGFLVRHKNVTEWENAGFPNFYPTRNDIRIPATGVVGGGGSFTHNLSGLRQQLIVTVRPYLIQGGEFVYGEVDSFMSASLPIVSTETPGSVTGTTIAITGYMHCVGAPTYTERGWVVSMTNMNPTIGGVNTGIAPASWTGRRGLFGLTLTGATPNTQFFIRAFATNAHGTAYGQTITVTTTDGDGDPTPQNAQVRFRKDANDPLLTAMGLANVHGNELASHFFGAGTGTSPYFQIPAGNHVPLFLDDGSWFFALPPPHTHNFQAGRRYTVVISGVYPNFIGSVIDDGIIPQSQVFQQSVSIPISGAPSLRSTRELIEPRVMDTELRERRNER